MLNFGHTFAHAIENLMGYGTIFHGEAVAIGMLMASKISLISQSDQERLMNLIINSGLPHKLEEFDKNKMLEIIEVQTGNNLSEDDIKRFDDIYGRKSK